MRVTDLKKEPATDAATVTTLAENVAVDAQERKGGWVRVRAGAAEGWVRLLALRYGGTAQSGDSGARELFNAARTGSSGTQVTTGVRGLDEQMLANARPNPAELAKMSQFSSTADGAAAFAAQGHLQRRVVPEVK
ncbi:MAG TPA: SH3 domain-containing protein [Burkholderiales bacterium]